MRKKYLNISELSILLGLMNKSGKPANHIIRFWEKEFKNIKPTTLKGGRRYYDSNQIKNIQFIKYLLKDKGLTIKGAKNILNKKKNIDVIDKNNIEQDYLKKNIKKKSFDILKKIKKLKNYG
tara:strand:- start:28 stop:393 length:366 start_codon:yes stop_codon:yes gene_type:complete